MSWREAFRRAAGVIVALIIVYVGGMIAFGVGAGIFAASANPFGDTNIPLVIVGGIFFLVGLLLMTLGGLAVYIKVVTDAVVDHVTERLASRQPHE